ncbi:MAG: (2Fe-2S)-binding protein [Candidatus Aminicenantales bacterium]
MSKKKKTVSRRDFLKGFGGGALGTAVVPKILSQEASSLKIKTKATPLISQKRISFMVNNQKYIINVEPRDTLLYILREKLNLTGTKNICGHGECGGCTVLLDGKPVYACLTLAIRVDRKKIITIEGLASRGKLHPIQQAFVEKDGYQCGFCTPGVIMSSIALLKKQPNPSLEEIKASLSGNLCRCGNYFKIYEAVSSAAEKMRRS